ncbi:hypothetical protein ACSBR2_024793 [Camellia fascicularis]
MTGSISSSGYRESSSDEGVRVLQQDSSIHGSSEFPSNFAVVRLESTLDRLSKWIVTALFGAVLLWRHDTEALWAAMGSVANVGLSTVLKQILNQERPVSDLRSDPGMPSSHAQSIFFTFVFAVFSMVEKLGINELTIALSVLTLAFGAYLSWLRVPQQLHTISQVAVGGVLGSIFSILWFSLWNAIVLKAFTVVLGAIGFCLGFLIYKILGVFTDRFCAVRMMGWTRPMGCGLRKNGTTSACSAGCGSNGRVMRLCEQLRVELNSFGGSITYEIQVYTAVLRHFVFFSQSICHNISLWTSRLLNKDPIVGLVIVILPLSQFEPLDSPLLRSSCQLYHSLSNKVSCGLSQCLTGWLHLSDFLDGQMHHCNSVNVIRVPFRAS